MSGGLYRLMSSAPNMMHGVMDDDVFHCYIILRGVYMSPERHTHNTKNEHDTG